MRSYDAMQSNNPFTKKLSIRLTPEQFDQLSQWQKKWSMQNLSQVVRELVKDAKDERKE